MRVYRVENEAGGGPYTTVWKHREYLKDAHSREGENWDGLVRHGAVFGIYGFIRQLGLTEEYHDRVICGFKDTLAMLLWFRDVWDKLSSGGFYVAEYEIPENHVLDTSSDSYEIGYLQCVFYRGTSPIARRQITGEEISELPDYMKEGDY